MAGTRGNRSAIPRLSPPSAISASCWAAKAGSDRDKVEKIAPAMAVPVRGIVMGFDEVVRGLGVMREMGFVGRGLDGLLEVMDLVLSMAMVVDSVAAIAAAAGGC